MENEAQDKYNSEDELVKWVHSEMRLAKRASSDWRIQATEDYAFYAGDQWSPEDAKILRDQGRPPVVFNRTARTINAVAGLEVQNRQEVRYVPRETSDNTLADYYSAIVKWARDATDAEDEDSEAFQDALTCGMGWTQTRLDYDRDQEGMIEVSRFDPNEAFWDSAARKRNLADRKWCARVKRYRSRDEVVSQWPNYTGLGESVGAYVDETPRAHDSSPPHYDSAQSGTNEIKPIEVVCFNWFDLEPIYRIAQSNGQIVEMPEDRFARIQEQIEAMGLRYVRQRKRKYRIAYVAGNQLLELVDSPVQSGFLFNCVTGLRNRNDNTWFGLVRLMLDPQKWANKWLSQVMHILNSNAKGGLMAEKDAFENPAKAEREWSDPSAITLLRPGALAAGKIKEKTMAQVPVGFERLMERAIEAISDTPGVNAELMGVVAREQPGILEITRKQAGVVMLGVFFDSLRRYRKEQGRVLADLVRDYISDGRKIRIIGPQGKPEVISLMRDALTFNYDIVVDDAPNSPSMKDKVFAVMQNLLPQLAPLGFPVPPEILDYLPLPSSVVEKWKAMIEKTPERVAMEQDAAMLERATKVAEIQKDQSQAELNQAKTQETLANVPAKAAGAAAQMAKAQQETVDTAAKVYMLRRGEPMRVQ